jgi:hypothetical protein
MDKEEEERLKQYLEEQSAAIAAEAEEAANAPETNL